jgi:hypothetical protein
VDTFWVGWFVVDPADDAVTGAGLMLVDPALVCVVLLVRLADSASIAKSIAAPLATVEPG